VGRERQGEVDAARCGAITENSADAPALCQATRLAGGGKPLVEARLFICRKLRGLGLFIFRLFFRVGIIIITRRLFLLVFRLFVVFSLRVGIVIITCRFVIIVAGGGLIFFLDRLFRLCGL